MPPMLEGIGMEYPLDRLIADPWQRRTLDEPIDPFEPFDRFLDAREGKVRSPENLVALGDAVFLRGDQGVPELPGAIEERRNFAIDVRPLARDHDAFLDPRMRHMRHDHLEIAMSAGDLVNRHGPGKLNRC